MNECGKVARRRFGRAAAPVIALLVAAIVAASCSGQYAPVPKEIESGRTPTGVISMASQGFAARMENLILRDYNPTRATVNGHAFDLEIARDAEARRLGLGGRESLDANAGMLFVFPAEGFHRFWMKGVPFRLDLLYIDSNGVIVDIQRMKAEPGVADPELTVYQPPEKVQLALEILGGMAEDLGLEAGMTIGFE